MKTQKEVRDLSYILCPRILSCGDDLNSEYRNGFVNGYLEVQQELFTLEDLDKVIEMAREGDFSHIEYFGYPDWTLTSDQIIDTIKKDKSEKST